MHSRDIMSFLAFANLFRIDSSFRLCQTAAKSLFQPLGMCHFHDAFPLVFRIGILFLYSSHRARSKRVVLYRDDECSNSHAVRQDVWWLVGETLATWNRMRHFNFLTVASSQRHGIISSRCVFSNGKSRDSSTFLVCATVYRVSADIAQQQVPCFYQQTINQGIVQNDNSIVCEKQLAWWCVKLMSLQQLQEGGWLQIEALLLVWPIWSVPETPELAEGLKEQRDQVQIRHLSE